jgi:hypothetical protein
MGILSDEQTSRIRAMRTKAERAAEMVKAADRISWWKITLRQRLTLFYQNSLRRNIEWTIQANHAMVLMAGPCHYCDILESGRFNGLDRVDSLKGYTLENVVGCCRWCNRAKGQNTVEEFTAWLQWVKGSKVREYLGTTGLVAEEKKRPG